jgi:beta-propeller repeat-containing protein
MRKRSLNTLLRRTLLAAITILFIVFTQFCEADQPWVARYDGSDHSNDSPPTPSPGGNPLVIDTHGNVYVTGRSTTADFGVVLVVIKYDSNGHLSSTWPDKGYGVGVRRFKSASNAGAGGYQLFICGNGG